MSRPPEDARGKALQIKGAQNDPLICDVEALALKIGLPAATMARILMREALDRRKAQK